MGKQCKYVSQTGKTTGKPGMTPKGKKMVPQPQMTRGGHLMRPGGYRKG